MPRTYQRLWGLQNPSRFNNHQQPPIVTLERINKSAHSDGKPAVCYNATAYGKEGDERNNIFEAVVDWKPLIDRGLQEKQHVRIYHIASAQPKTIWQEELAISAKHQNYSRSFINMLTEFQFVSDCHLRCINVANYRIKLLRPYIALIQSVLYCAGLKTRAFEKTKVKDTLAKNIIELAQTE